MYKKVLFYSVLFCACAAAAPCARAGFSGDDAGTAAAQVLKLGAGARAAGMGDAFTAVADDASAVYWNPGGLAWSKKHSVSLMHAMLVEDISYDWLGYVQPLGAGTFGAGLQRLSYGSLAGTDATGLETSGFSPAETAVTLSYGIGSGDFGFGGSLKYISGKIKRSASAFAADLGVNYHTSPESGPSMEDADYSRFSFGFALRNLGGKIKYVSAADPLPLTFKAGAAYKPEAEWTVAADAELPYDNSLVLGLGGEYGRRLEGGLKVSARAGYNTRTKDLGGLSGITLGAGGNYDNISVDYAFIPFGDLGTAHKISLSIDF